MDESQNIPNDNLAGKPTIDIANTTPATLDQTDDTSDDKTTEIKIETPTNQTETMATIAKIETTFVPQPPTIEPTTLENKTTEIEKETKEKLEKAKLAMEGPARTAIREEREHDQSIKNQLSIIENKIAEIAKQKETLELNWIKLDENRTGLRNMINPIAERETSLEADEGQLEEQEKNTVNDKEKMALEQKRWGIQEQRHKAEEEKWIYENRLFKIEDQIKDNTANYQKLLDEEEKLLKEKEQLEKEK